MLEWMIKCVLGILISIIGFYLKRSYDRMDRMEKELTDHRIADAANFITRVEHDNKMIALKDDIRGMISPIRESVQNIERFLREGRS